MTAPAVSVQIGFDATASLGNNFVLDSGPVTTGKGALNNSTYTLAGTVFVDVTQWCSGQIRTNRGRSREIDQYQAGTLQFTLRNEDRRFDPANTAGPYYPGVVPRALVNAYVEGVQVFGGYIDDLDVTYQKPNICEVTVSCLDGFTVAANTFLASYSASQQTSGQRITAVLSTISYPATQSIATGQATLQSNIFTSTPSSPIAALDHLQTCARSENGYLFVDRTGVMTFFDRYKVLGETSAVTFSDLGDGIGYQDIGQRSQALLLYNQVNGTRNANANIPGDAPIAQIANDTVSQQKFLTRALSLSMLENLLDSDVENICLYLVGRYSEPEVRFDSLTIELQSLTQAQITQLASLDLVQLVTVKRTPPGTGTPSTIVLLSVVDGIAFALDVSASSYKMTLQLGSIDSRLSFKLDDSVFGVLDSGILNY